MIKQALAAAVVALAFAAPAAAHPARTHLTWKTMTLTQRHTVVLHEIQVHRTAIRWWLNHRTRIRYPASSSSPFVYCRAVGIHTPGVICVHAQKLVKAIHVRDHLDAQLAELEFAREAARLRRMGASDFETAARYADRIFPGSYGWLMNCSTSEGGHGRFVMNAGGSGAGGWMQFLSSTFYGNVAAAFAEAASRGYPIPASAASWSSPLGQAVTAAYMLRHGQSGQWSGGSC